MQAEYHSYLELFLPKLGLPSLGYCVNQFRYPLRYPVELAGICLICMRTEMGPKIVLLMQTEGENRRFDHGNKVDPWFDHMKVRF